MKKDLLAMGYRELDKGKWAKPFGYSVLVFYEDDLKWVQLFKSLTGEIISWHKPTIYGEDKDLDVHTFLEWLKYVENNKVHLSAHLPSTFEFLTVEQQFELYDNRQH